MHVFGGTVTSRYNRSCDRCSVAPCAPRLVSFSWLGSKNGKATTVPTAGIERYGCGTITDFSPTPLGGSLAVFCGSGFAEGIVQLESLYMSDIRSLTDEYVRRLYENIREQAAADARLGGRHRLIGETARQQAERLRAEMDRRRLKFTPIEW
jgi:hypothetical protein